MEQEKLFYIFGSHPIFSALEAKHITVKKIFMSAGLKDKNASRIQYLTQKNNVPLELVKTSLLDEMVPDQNHQGLVACVKDGIIYKDISCLKDKKLVVILDHLQDPHNLGAILRNADQFGVQGVILPKKRSVEVTPTVIKTSSGAAFFMPIIKESSLLNVVAKLKEYGFWIYATSSHEGENIYNVDWADKVAIILGSEGKGVSEQLEKQADFKIAIPSNRESFVDSLNVSAASAIILSQVHNNIFYKQES